MSFFFHQFNLRIEEMLREHNTADDVLHSWDRRRILEDLLTERGFTVLAGDSTFGVLPQTYIVGADERDMAVVKRKFFDAANRLGLLYSSGETYRQVQPSQLEASTG